MAQIAAKVMQTAAIEAEIENLAEEWDDMMDGLEESGGKSGSPGEWIVERLYELEGELKRRRSTPPLLAKNSGGPNV